MAFAVSSLIDHFAPPPFSIVFDISLFIIERSFTMKISAAKLSHVLLSWIEVEIPFSMFLVIVNSAKVDIPIGIGYLCLPYQIPINPFPFVFFAVWKDKESPACKFADSHIFYLSEDWPTSIANFPDLKKSYVFQNGVTLFLGCGGAFELWYFHFAFLIAIWTVFQGFLHKILLGKCCIW